MNYDFTAISNYFRVKHPKQAQDILNGLGFYTESADDGSICFYSSDSQYHDEMYVLKHVHTGIIIGHYDSYNEFFMTRFNFGGFQAAIPLQVQPWGIFVNTGDLEKYYVVY